MIKNTLISFTTSLVLFNLAAPAQAYLVPLIGGLGWLIAVLIGGIIAAATFIWAVLQKLKKKPTSQHPQETNTKNISDSDDSH